MKRDEVYLNDKIFRSGTKHKARNFFFVLNGGGIGDYLNFIPALQWIEKMNPQVRGTVVAPIQVIDIVRFIFKGTRFQVMERNLFFSKADNIMKKDDLKVDPTDWPHYVSAIGSHLMDLGFMYYTNMSRPQPGFEFLPDLSGYKPKDTNWPELDLSKPFGVITTGFTAETREMKSQYVNELSKYMLSKKVTPVFLGKKDFTKKGEKAFESGYYAKFSDEIDFSLGVDLREKTSLLDAAYIMSQSKFVLGIDNGLLNLAGCTKATVIYGHTITKVQDRELRRREGLTFHIVVDESILRCSGCQNKVRFIFGHKFRRCMYGDLLCLDYLFNDNCATWKKAIDKALE